jgi:hypothetical protein
MYVSSGLSHNKSFFFWWVIAWLRENTLSFSVSDSLLLQRLSLHRYGVTTVHEICTRELSLLQHVCGWGGFAAFRKHYTRPNEREQWFVTWTTTILIIIAEVGAYSVSFFHQTTLFENAVLQDQQAMCDSIYNVTGSQEITTTNVFWTLKNLLNLTG